mmetsp:Transcript_755/g.2169  ORF Transcript_755/g.2169 Transcript_755/m.2169 type:complete len:280 (+) Transcript_755:2564-3403(+)
MARRLVWKHGVVRVNKIVHRAQKLRRNVRTQSKEVAGALDEDLFQWNWCRLPTFRVPLRKTVLQEDWAAGSVQLCCPRRNVLGWAASIDFEGIEFKLSGCFGILSNMPSDSPELRGLAAAAVIGVCGGRTASETSVGVGAGHTMSATGLGPRFGAVQAPPRFGNTCSEIILTPAHLHALCMRRAIHRKHVGKASEVDERSTLWIVKAVVYPRAAGLPSIVNPDVVVPHLEKRRVAMPRQHHRIDLGEDLGLGDILLHKVPRPPPHGRGLGEAVGVAVGA